MGKVANQISEKLQSALSPIKLDVIDDSDSHIGHAGHSGAGESHFNVLIVAEAFEGKNRVMRQRLVMGALKEELAGPVHALSIKAIAPSEQ